MKNKRLWYRQIFSRLFPRKSVIAADRPNYRPDIDGLRAIAVLSVLFFHLDETLLPGGYTGVDIFFVISGYLIIQLIHKEILGGSFSVITFYERRARRLFPALFATIAATFVVGFIIFMPDELRSLGAGAAAAAAFSANILFWLQADYFTGPEFLPLLHTWSLAVEEQFYLVAPALLLLLCRWSAKTVRPALLVLGAASFALSCLWAFKDPSGNFYLPHTRAWELIIGGLVALGAVPAITKRPVREVVGFLGLILILAPLLLLDRESVFPAWNALSTCVGTAMLIHSGEGRGALVSRMLGTPILVGIGLISYSLYLVHWPVLVFWRYQLLREPTTIELVLMASVSMIVAWASWRFLETPFRDRSRTSRATIFSISAASGAAAIILGVVIFRADGFPMRIGAEAAIAVRDDAQTTQTARCFLREGWDEWEGEACYLARNNAPTILLWGNSHAHQYAPVIRKTAGSYNADILEYASAGCPPVLGVPVKTRPFCQDNNAHVLQIIQDYDVKRVVLSANWEYSFNKNGLTLKMLKDTVDTLREARVEVMVIGDNPDFPFRNPTYLAVRLARRDDPDQAYYARVRNDWAFNEQMAEHVGPESFYDPFELLCRDKECLVYEDGNLLMYDNAHMASYGVMKVLSDKKLRDFFNWDGVEQNVRASR